MFCFHDIRNGGKNEVSVTCCEASRLSGHSGPDRDDFRGRCDANKGTHAPSTSHITQSQDENVVSSSQQMEPRRISV